MSTLPDPVVTLAQNVDNLEQQVRAVRDQRDKDRQDVKKLHEEVTSLRIEVERLTSARADVISESDPLLAIVRLTRQVEELRKQREADQLAREETKSAAEKLAVQLGAAVRRDIADVKAEVRSLLTVDEALSGGESLSATKLSVTFLAAVAYLHEQSEELRQRVEELTRTAGREPAGERSEVQS